MARERRSKKEVLISKIEEIGGKIEGYNQKIEALEAQRNDLQEELDTIEEAERRAADEAQMKEVIRLMKEKNVSLDELKELVQNREAQ